MVYLILIILLLVSIYRHDIHKKPFNKFLVIFYPIIFALLAGLSYRMGVDCIRYEAKYEYISFSNLDFDYLSQEPGYLIFICICKYLHLPWFMVHTIICLFLNLSISTFFKRFAYHSYFTCLLIYAFLFYYLFNFEILRQSISMSILLLYFAKNGINIRKGYFATVLFASVFHYVAIIAFIIPLIIRVKWNVKKSIFVLFSVIIVGNIIALRFGDFLRVLESLYSGLGRYNEMYADSETYTSRLNIFGQIQVLFLQILPFMIPLVFCLKVKSSNNGINILVLCYCIFILLGTYVSILNRISYFFSIPAIVLLCNYLVTIKNKFTSFPIVMLLIMNIYVFYNLTDGYDFKNIQKLHPYTSVIDKSVDYDREVWIDRVVYKNY